jgi:hypothetical protein
MSYLPPLDQPPTGKAKDFDYLKIKKIAGITGAERPASYKNPLAQETAPRDQFQRGTCVGQSTAHSYDILYMKLTGDTPTAEDKHEWRTNIVDELGTVHDILYPQSASAECFYQKSREIGGVTYPSGSELRWVVRAWKDYGMNTEVQWHTDKTGNKVWMPSPRKTSDGGLSPEEAAAFAKDHLCTGYAMVGEGTPRWEQICQAIYDKGFVLGAIPVYANFDSMRFRDGTFPDPDYNGSWDCSGYHALCFYGYDSEWLYLIHSWGGFCERFGKLSKHYFDYANTHDGLEFWVVLDDEEVRIARGYYSKMTIYTNCANSRIYVDGILMGVAPLTLSIEHRKLYSVKAECDGYVPQIKSMDDSSFTLVFELVPLPNRWKALIDSILNILHKIFGG